MQTIIRNKMYCLCLSVCHVTEPWKNGWTNRDAFGGWFARAQGTMYEMGWDSQTRKGNFWHCQAHLKALESLMQCMQQEESFNPQ